MARYPFERGAGGPYNWPIATRLSLTFLRSAVSNPIQAAAGHESVSKGKGRLVASEW